MASSSTQPPPQVAEVLDELKMLLQSAALQEKIRAAAASSKQVAEEATEASENISEARTQYPTLLDAKLVSSLDAQLEKLRSVVSTNSIQVDPDKRSDVLAEPSYNAGKGADSTVCGDGTAVTSQLSEISELLARRTGFFWREGTSALSSVSDWLPEVGSQDIHAALFEKLPASVGEWLPEVPSQEDITAGVGEWLPEVADQYVQWVPQLIGQRETELPERGMVDAVIGARDGLEEIYEDVGDGYLAVCDAAREWLTTAPTEPRGRDQCRCPLWQA